MYSFLLSQLTNGIHSQFVPLQPSCTKGTMWENSHLLGTLMAIFVPLLSRMFLVKVLIKTKKNKNKNKNKKQKIISTLNIISMHYSSKEKERGGGDNAAYKSSASLGRQFSPVILCSIKQLHGCISTPPWMGR